jgi:IclR family transcriptional regulator, pca regulon regulatory protein
MKRSSAESRVIAKTTEPGSSRAELASDLPGMAQQRSVKGAPPNDLSRHDWIAGLQNGLAIIEGFDHANARQSAAQVAARAGMSRNAARRHLLTLQALGYMATDGRLFWLTPAVMRLGHCYLDSARLPRLAQPYLQRITMGTGETAFLSVLDGPDMVYLARNGSNVYMNTGYVVGARVQAHVTSAGLLMMSLQPLAWQEHWLATHELKPYTSHTVTDGDTLRKIMAGVRSQQWCVSDQQLEMGMRGVAVPLRDIRGDVVAALNVTMPIGRETQDHAVQRVLPVLQEATRAMRDLV